MSQSLVSVVMATYNGERFLFEQLTSIAQQSLMPFEVIIQDDCSSDSTVEIVRQFENILPIKIFINSENRGYINNFESAIKRATGKYIALCDQDDIWEKDKLETLVNNIGTADLIFSNSLFIDSTGNSLNKTLSQRLKSNFCSCSSPLSFAYENCVSAHAMLFNRALLDYIFPFPKSLFFDAWIAANAAGRNGVKYHDACLVQYRQHATNTVGTKRIKKSVWAKITEKAKKKQLDNLHSYRCLVELASSKLLSEHDRFVLDKLIKAHKEFDNTFYNPEFYKTLKNGRYEIYRFSGNKSILKKAIGYKSYKWLPIL